MSASAETSSDLAWHGDWLRSSSMPSSVTPSPGASDVHVEPVESGYEVRYRIDGLLQPIAAYGAEAGRAVVGRLMVLANLLTYRVDLPQEGRLASRRMPDRTAPWIFAWRSCPRLRACARGAVARRTVAAPITPRAGIASERPGWVPRLRGRRLGDVGRNGAGGVGKDHDDLCPVAAHRRGLYRG